MRQNAFGKFVFRGLLCLEICCGTGVAQSAEEVSAQSGTLVMVGKISDAVIVSVDSKLTGVIPLPPFVTPMTPIDADRKLVDIGTHSACAINGNLGTNKNGYDVSAALRAWVAENPTKEAYEAIESLLEATEVGWNSMHYPVSHMPNNRKLNEAITTLTCGDFVDGHPVIVRGETFAKSDGFGGQVADYRILPSERGDLLYVDGIIHPTKNFEILMNPPNPHPQSNLINAHDLDELLLDLQSKAIKTAFDEWRKADNDVHGVAGATSSWSKSSVQDLFIGVFSSIEHYFPEHVGEPNQVRIITACGRFTSTVEETWRSCPSPTSKSNRGSITNSREGPVKLVR
jgi:hypothetical protein